MKSNRNRANGEWYTLAEQKKINKVTKITPFSFKEAPVRCGLVVATAVFALPFVERKSWRFGNAN